MLNVFKTTILRAKEKLFLQPPLFLQKLFLQVISTSKLKICCLNTIFENVAKFQRLYYHGNRKQFNFFSTFFISAIYIVLVYSQFFSIYLTLRIHRNNIAQIIIYWSHLKLNIKHGSCEDLSICTYRCNRDFAPQLFRSPRGEIPREIALPRAIQLISLSKMVFYIMLEVEKRGLFYAKLSWIRKHNNLRQCYSNYYHHNVHNVFKTQRIYVTY